MHFHRLLWLCPAAEMANEIHRIISSSRLLLFLRCAMHKCEIHLSVRVFFFSSQFRFCSRGMAWWSREQRNFLFSWRCFQLQCHLIPNRFGNDKWCRRFCCACLFGFFVHFPYLSSIISSSSSFLLVQFRLCDCTESAFDKIQLFFFAIAFHFPIWMFESVAEAAINEQYLVTCLKILTRRHDHSSSRPQRSRE